MDQESETIFHGMTQEQRLGVVALQCLDERLGKAGWGQSARFMIVVRRDLGGPAGMYGYFSFPTDFAELAETPSQALTALAAVALERAATGKTVLPPEAKEDFYAVALFCEGIRVPHDAPDPEDVRTVHLLDRQGWLTTSVRVRGEAMLAFRVPDPQGWFEDAGPGDVAIIRGLADIMLAVGTAHPEAGVDLDAVAKVGH